MAGRLPGFRMTNEEREKIRNSRVLTNLIAHVEGRKEMSRSQVTAGIALLKKVLPDLRAVEHKAGDEDMAKQLIEYVITHPKQ